MSAEMFIPAPPLFLSLQLYEHLSSYAGTEKNSLVEYAFQHGGLRVGSTPGFQSYRNKLALKKKKKISSMAVLHCFVSASALWCSAAFQIQEHVHSCRKILLFQG